MKRTRKWSFLTICLILIATLLYSGGDFANADVTLPAQYYFVINGQQKVAGTEYEMKSAESLISITSGTWEPASTVQWISSETGVVALESTSYGSNFCNMVRKGPGYSTITAIITQGTSKYTLSCLIKVDLSFDVQKSGLTNATMNDRILIINSLDEEKHQVYLKYVDYTQEDQTTVSGSAISATAVQWASEDESVATVDEYGKVKAVGAGSTKLTVTTNTLSAKDDVLEKSIDVVVKPTFSLTYEDASGAPKISNSVEKESLSVPAQGVPSSFVIESNSSFAKNLKWEVYDYSNPGTKISQSTTTKMTYTISDLSGNVSFTNVKAGTYEIYAFADDTYSTNTNVPYAYMKIIVPIDVGEKNIVMNVGDTYSIEENSNIPGIGVFKCLYAEGNLNIAKYDESTGIITAKSKGQVKLQMVYQTGQNLYDNVSVIIPDIFINITVIDGISLSTTSATMYNAGTLLLNAIVTDPTQPITWTSSDVKIATVEDGLVKGIKAGIAIITAKQVINGIVKKATCEITVQQSVATITVDPAEVTLAIGAYQTLHATITPKNLSGVTLTWKSSNENIAKIVESSKLSATIQGVAGGTAVISAINQDNVVVGYCHVSVQQPVTSLVLSETDVAVDLSAKKLQLRATVFPENAMNKKVNWSSSDATKAKVDENGLVTFLKPGAVTIIATSDDNPSVKVLCNLTIQVPIVSIALDETAKTMYVGESVRLSYLILPSNASNNSVIWTSTNASVATVDSTGKVAAKSVGTTVIILKSLEGAHSVYCTIIVKRVATTVKFDVSELTLSTGEYYYIEAALTPKDSTDTDLVWESSDSKVAVVDAKGKVVAKDAGTTIIMARTPAGGVAYCKITVLQPVDGLLLNFTDKVIYVDGSFQLKVSVSPSEATELGVTWKSSNAKVASVSAKGFVEGLTGGTTVITCTTTDGGYSAVCVVTVRELVSTITINQESYKLGTGKTVVLKATVSTQTSSNQKVTWISSNQDIATVSQKGKVLGVSTGYATITAIAKDGSEVEDSCEIRVVKLVTTLTLNKNYASLLVGDNLDLKATIKPSNSTYRTAKWTSSDNKVAIVDEDGVITALKAGEAMITAAAKDSSGKKSICYVVVRDRVASTGITVMDKKVVMVSGEEKTVQVAINPMDSNDKYSWSSDNIAVAKVDKKTGKISARATGTANVTVMTDTGKTAVVEVTVIGLNITSLTLEQYYTYEYALTVEGATSTVKWSIDNPAIAVVSNGIVSSRAIGTATITAVVNGRKLTCKLKVVKIRS